MKKSIARFSALIALALAINSLVYGNWQDDFYGPTTTATVTPKPQAVIKQIDKLLTGLNGEAGRKGNIVPSLVAALQEFGHTMPDIMQAASQEGSAPTLRTKFRQLALATQKLIASLEPDKAGTIKKIIAIIYANHPPAQANQPEHAPCLNKLELDWYPGAAAGLWEQYVEGVPHASNMITFCSRCMPGIKQLLQDAARRQQACTELKNALWQFEQQL